MRMFDCHLTKLDNPAYEIDERADQATMCFSVSDEETLIVNTTPVKQVMRKPKYWFNQGDAAKKSIVVKGITKMLLQTAGEDDEKEDDTLVDVHKMQFSFKMVSKKDPESAI